MRVFLPAVSTELGGDAPVVRDGWIVQPAAGVRGEDLEVLEDDAVTEAALDSLTLGREAQGVAARRLVLALDLPPADLTAPGEDRRETSDEGVVRTVGVPALTWSAVEAVLIDGRAAEDDVRRVWEAVDQESADGAVAVVWEHALEWYDGAERLALAASLMGC